MKLTDTREVSLASHFNATRLRTLYLCETLETEDFVVQPVVDVSPLKWHIGHTTWFFEHFVLVSYVKGYQPFHPKYHYLFNSYYVAAGDRWKRVHRGLLTRPTVKELFRYREYVDKHINDLCQQSPIYDISKVIELGIHHEQQHQELFLYDIKRILGDNPLNPIFRPQIKAPVISKQKEWLKMEEGIYEIGYKGYGFHFDNELALHKTYLHAYEIESGLVTNGEYLEFMKNGGYESFQYWFQEAWDWVNAHKIKAPRYWAEEDGNWWHYTLGGYEKVNPNDPVSHISYYEATAYAQWNGCRLPTEFEWEAACKHFSPDIPTPSNFLEDDYFKPVQLGNYDFYGNLWEWTSSAYAPYPYFNTVKGALGEYNGKFMVNQMVLRGGSFGTAKKHIRSTYRNFFHPHLRWLFSGIRLAKHINK